MAAAKQFVKFPDGMYNPLFLRGGVGSGKTHLLHAIGNAYQLEREHAKILLVTSNQLTEDLADAYGKKEFSAFKDRYHALDMLLIDDWQWHTKGESGLDTFTFLFDELLQKGARISVSYAAEEEEGPHLHTGLESRLSPGRTLDLGQPDIEARIAILLALAESEALPIPRDVAVTIACIYRNDVRAMQGALKKLLAHARHLQCELSISTVESILGLTTHIVNRSGD